MPAPAAPYMSSMLAATLLPLQNSTGRTSLEATPTYFVDLALGFALNSALTLTLNLGLVSHLLHRCSEPGPKSYPK